MKISLIIVSLILFIVGLILTITIIGALIGIPLIIISIILFVLGVVIPGPIMRKVIKKGLKPIMIIVAVIVLITILAFFLGPKHWQDDAMLSLLKPYSESCGSSDGFYSEDCICDGTMLTESMIGLSPNYCYGTCSECLCYQLNETSQEKMLVNCSS
jgi:hypothetical protein